MLIISDGVAEAYLGEGLHALRQKILKRWFDSLSPSANLAGEAGRAEVLSEIEQMAREDPDLTETDLMMLADLRLVAVASEARERRA